VNFLSYLLRFAKSLSPLELAALTGMGDRNGPGFYPGRDTPTRHGRGRVATKPYDPTEDDPIDHSGSVKSSPAAEQNQYIVAPSILVRPEFSTITRNSDPTQPLTCIVIIELPGKRGTSNVPGPVMPDVYTQQRTGPSRHETGQSVISSGQTRQRGYSSVSDMDASPHGSQPPGRNTNHSLSSPTTSYQDDQDPADPYTPSSTGETHEDDSPFSAITEDLRNRIIDWKGHPLSGLGSLQMYDLLSVRRDSLVREFFVYLFKEAIICVVEEKKRSLGRLLSNASTFDSGSTGGGSSLGPSKGVLRLKGRIYVRHIKQVTASSSAGEMSLTIDMEDERLDSFILIFKDRSSLEAWKNQIQALVNMFQQQHPQPPQPNPYDRGPDLEEFGGSAKAARILSGSTGTSVSTADSLLNSGRSTMSSSTSHGSMAHRQMYNKLQPLGEDDELNINSNYDPTFGLVTPHMSSGPSNSLTPLPHPPLDLILVVSIPPPNAVPSTAALKVRVIKASLDFVVASLGAKDRLSLVTFEVGPAGQVRKTPFLCVGRTQSRARLAKFIDEIGVEMEEGPFVEDEFLVKGSKDEKTDVVTAVNHGK
jgi:Pleckstrin homology domain